MDVPVLENTILIRAKQKVALAEANNLAFDKETGKAYYQSWNLELPSW
jgi:hypothetical protein